MEGFAFAGGLVPMGGNELPNFKIKNRYTGNELNFRGGDPGLQYRFWNQAENGYASSDIDRADAEIIAEEAAFLGLENLFACRKQCKKDLGGASSLRNCIRDCKGKGLTKSALKTKEAETEAIMAQSLSKLTANDSAVSEAASKSKTMLWVIVGIVVLIIISLVIYFMTRKKAEVIV